MTFVAFDLEATGLSLMDDRIVEVGAVRFDDAGAVVATFSELVRAERPTSAKAGGVHQIAEGLLAQSRPPADVLPEFVSFLGDPTGATLLAHNAAFDAGLLGAELIRLGRPLPGLFVVDTLAWSRRHRPQLASHKLAALARAIGVADPPAHRALGDSDLLRQVYLALPAIGSDPAARPPLAFPFYDPRLGAPVPRGWEAVADAIRDGASVEIVYASGSHGPTPRLIAPVRFEQDGGVSYIAARCQIDGKLKRFRVERVVSYRVLKPAASSTPADGIGP